MLADSVATLYLSVMRTESGSPSDSKLQICVADSPVGCSRERERERERIGTCAFVVMRNEHPCCSAGATPHGVPAHEQL